MTNYEFDFPLLFPANCLLVSGVKVGILPHEGG